MTNKVWTKDEIKRLLETNDKMVSRSLLKLFEYQTSSEQDTEETSENNGVGFNGIDAGFLTSVAKQIIAGRSLTEKQLKATRKSILKYSGQLTRIANAE